MKKIITFLSIFISLSLFTQVFAQEQEASKGPKIYAMPSTHDFGDIYQGDKVSHTFEIENQGTAPLLLSNVKTTCGCTAPEWPKEAIKPGEKANIKVTFNSRGKSGYQNKTITVMSNATESMYRLKIFANVLPPKKDGE
ncbi:DUF1573 domain-containing protein [Sediminitomix flava]|uniref:Uncharacterized protein DUF1573 n=1 Tax=Sediminitomix flava TaxID=379075 RepID=A0A315Z9L4_SEDFL|nr:DUF1573 domain-containing protein [Sediminitomix flava]PWJ40750.1 uncharacterized protein DUF1573 [Sediminitomix flava]